MSDEKHVPSERLKSLLSQSGESKAHLFSRNHAQLHPKSRREAFLYATGQEKEVPPAVQAAEEFLIAHGLAHEITRKIVTFGCEEASRERKNLFAKEFCAVVLPTGIPMQSEMKTLIFKASDDKKNPHRVIVHLKGGDKEIDPSALRNLLAEHSLTLHGMDRDPALIPGRLNPVILALTPTNIPTTTLIDDEFFAENAPVYSNPGCNSWSMGIMHSADFMHAIESVLCAQKDSTVLHFSKEIISRIPAKVNAFSVV